MFKKTLLSFFGIGFIRGGGTLTSIVVLCLFLLSPWSLLPLGALAIIALPLCPKKPHDPRWVTTDEVAGQVLALLPLLLWDGGFSAVVVSFFAFRLLDVAKPPPIKSLQRPPNPWGVYLDDIAAGGIAAVATTAFLFTV